MEATGGAAADSVAVEATLGGKRVGGAPAARFGTAAPVGAWPVSSAAVGPGEHVLRVSLAAAGGGDAEPRTDTRLHIVTVAPTPGVVLLAAPGDWDSRFLYRTLREVAQLPVRGFVRVDPRTLALDGGSPRRCRRRRCGRRRGGPIC